MIGPGDLIALVTFEGAVYPNLAITRERLGKPQQAPHALAAALTGMGFGVREARAAVRAAIKELGGEGGGAREREQEVLRRAVARLSSLTAERTAAAAAADDGSRG